MIIQVAIGNTGLYGFAATDPVINILQGRKRIRVISVNHIVTAAADSVLAINSPIFNALLPTASLLTARNSPNNFISLEFEANVMNQLTFTVLDRVTGAAPANYTGTIITLDVTSLE